MTVYELYNESIKPLQADERLHMAKLILDDLAPDALRERSSDVRDLVHLEHLLLDSLASGPLIEANADFWASKERRVFEKLGAA